MVLQDFAPISAKVAAVAVNPGQLSLLFYEGAQASLKCTKGLPAPVLAPDGTVRDPGAQLIRLGVDGDHFMLIFTHDSFASVPEGHVIPIVEIAFAPQGESPANRRARRAAERSQAKARATSAARAAQEAPTPLPPAEGQGPVPVNVELSDEMQAMMRTQRARQAGIVLPGVR